MTRLQIVGFACWLMAALALSGSECGGVTSQWLYGLWGGSAPVYRMCFYVSEDETQLMPSTACNLEPSNLVPYSYEMRGEDNAGVDQDGNECGFGFGYEEPVPIVDDTFAVEGHTPSGSADEFSFNGTFNGDSASGTTTKVNGQSRCDIEWTASRMEDGTGGTGGTGGSSGLGGLGDICESTGDCDPNASSLGVFCCMEGAATCGNNVGQCVEDCSQFSSGGEVGMVEGALCQDNNECGAGLFCCLVPDAAGNCDFGLDQSCTCRNGATTDCADVTPGNGGFGEPCRNDGDCADGLPCCTSTEVSSACGVEVRLCECI